MCVCVCVCVCVCLSVCLSVFLCVYVHLLVFKRLVKSFGKKFFAYRGYILWNELPNSIKQIQDFENSRNTVKSHFLDLH